MFTPANILTLIIAASLNMLLGFAWYSPQVFGKPWMKLSNITPDKMKQSKAGMTKMLILGFAAAVVQAFVLDLIFGAIGATRLISGLLIAFWLWLGLAFPVAFNPYLYEKKPLKLVAIHAGYYLVALLVMGAFLVRFS